MNHLKFIFPAGFYWGSATSAHQVEGGDVNDWTEWERANSARLTAEAIRRHANAFARTPDFILKNYPNPLQKENYISGRACDHYNRYEQDFDIAKSLGHNAHRFSIEWSRVEPKQGKFNEAEIEHYRKVILALKKRGIEPFVALWHWPIPLWLRDEGGWQCKKIPDYFSRYTQKISTVLGKDVRFWITLNEPEIYTSNSYLAGAWPPQKRNLFAYLNVLHNLIKSHRKAYEVIKKINPNAKIGISKNNIYFEACQNKIANRLLKKFIDWWWNFYFLNRIKNYQDFIGLNHYFHNRIKGFRFNQNENKTVSDMGWELYPEAIYFVLKDLKKYNKPIYITENGLADAQDKNRGWFIKETLKNVARTIQEGVDIRGYFYWSLLDNFEWDKGFWPRFGLAEIDYSAKGGKTLERKIRPSAYEYKKIIEDSAIEA
ncbi:glycoside hydrolase family 1 protein [Candidatus Wolfebacteria bacterium CG03_land_8_20_14_0_80_40_12]|uniref:Glycoside hydrolase family 1 protein n=1 Tax=Candidatus Wolfebacteria bacterium CG03_land_8_20_14_0_80_40_12 TaxID=1975069 RepID=A0A2M7B5I1_9BACT|nr:MAG: glycoside hydrolase family 1 protein [Candidatus Wolfebacteria bacterium CG03_land_8_20_14_0_80_40_12]